MALVLSWNCGSVVDIEHLADRRSRRGPLHGHHLASLEEVLESLLEHRSWLMESV